MQVGITLESESSKEANQCTICGVYGLPVKFLVTNENVEPKNIGMNVSLNIIFNVLEDMQVDRTLIPVRVPSE
jgi:hypothetical protein